MIPVRGSVCVLTEQSKALAREPTVAQWHTPEDVTLSASATADCNTYLVEVKRPKRSRVLYLRAHAIDPTLRSIDLENAEVRVIRFRLLPHAQWQRNIESTPAPRPSVSVVTSSSKLSTRTIWQAGDGSEKWIAGMPGESLRSGVAGNHETRPSRAQPRTSLMGL